MKTNFFPTKNNRKINDREKILEKLKLNKIKKVKLKSYLKYNKSYFDDKTLGIGYGGYKNDGRFKSTAKKFIRFFKLKKESNVLEIGCAKGYLLDEFCRKGINSYGIDISTYAVSKNRKMVKKKVKIFNVEKGIPYNKRFFDLVISKDTLPLIKRSKIKNVIKEINRVVKNKKNIFLQIQGVSNKKRAYLMSKWDPTHHSCLTSKEWFKKLRSYGYRGYIEIKHLF